MPLGTDWGKIPSHFQDSPASFEGREMSQDQSSPGGSLSESFLIASAW